MQEVQQKSTNPDRDPVRMKKTLQQAQTMAFTTRFFYFCMNVLFCYILYKYGNTLTGDWMRICLFGMLLAVNGYLIMSTGNDPGFESSLTIMNTQQQQHSKFINNSDNYCDICNCRKKLRTKHCFRCGKCVRKYDHHCPWIGSCVGQANHLKFCIMTLMQTIQSVACFLIVTFTLTKCFSSVQLYQYKEGDDNYSQQFGVFAIFSFFMLIYVMFVGTLFLYHSYLVLMNLTTTQLIYRSKSKYLSGIKGNPFNRGIVTNLLQSIKIPAQGHQWIIEQNQSQDINRHWVNKVFSNQYYDCC